ncbi:hypothetical protein [Burkholderia gladioli]|uniref:hypothetical protein n=1 Tax=Burkholderia gladioli TaxID=28095 RepID=UPI00163FB4D8|nr:hypothetical protein [Burkholderia gladioli]
MTNQSTTSGIGFGPLLFLVFLVLKLTGYIGWSWWWVTAPLWGGLAILLGVLAIVGIMGGVTAAIKR